MWEWSNDKKNQISADNTSLLEAYASYLPKTPVTHQEASGELPSPQQMEHLLQQQIIALGLKNISLKLIDFRPLSWEKKHQFSEEQVRGRKIFLKILGYSHTELCLSSGLTDKDIKLLKQSISPENYCVHIKIPFEFGGQPSLDNMCLVKTHPIHDSIHALLEFQLEKDFLKHYKKLFIPYIEGIIKNA